MRARKHSWQVHEINSSGAKARLYPAVDVGAKAPTPGAQHYFPRTKRAAYPSQKTLWAGSRPYKDDPRRAGQPPLLQRRDGAKIKTRTLKGAGCGGREEPKIHPLYKATAQRVGHPRRKPRNAGPEAGATHAPSGGTTCAGRIGVARCLRAWLDIRRRPLRDIFRDLLSWLWRLRQRWANGGRMDFAE